jgi:hypothetical protein
MAAHGGPASPVGPDDDAALDELHLIQSSLLPDETFAWLLPADQAARWAARLQAHAGLRTPDAEDAHAPPLAPAHFRVQLSPDVSVEVEAEADGAGLARARVSIKGDLSRREQARWQQTVGELRSAAQDADEATANPCVRAVRRSAARRML